MKNSDNYKIKYQAYINKSADVAEICQPLRQHFDITSFVYQKNFNDGSDIRLTNQPAWLEHFINQDYYKISGFEKSPEHYQSGHVIWAHLTHHQLILENARQFNIDHGMTLINKTEDGCEFVFFGTTPDNDHLVNFYLNNIYLLQRFLIYFKEKAAPILSQLSNQRIYIPNKYNDVVSHEYGIPNLSDDFKEQFIRSTKISKYLLDDTTLSSRELDCVRLLMQGKTAKEIGKQLFISPRTVDTHLIHLKEKLKCRTKSQLMSKLAEVISIRAME